MDSRYNSWVRKPDFKAWKRSFESTRDFPLLDPEVALLPQICALREKLEARTATIDEMKLFARSQLSRDDTALVLDLIRDSDDRIAAAAVSAAFYSGGITGFGSLLERWLTSEPTNAFELGIGPSTLAQCVIACHDPTAARALLHARPDRFDIADAFDQIYETLTPNQLGEIAQASSYTPVHIIELLHTGAESKARTIWLLKQFWEYPQAVQCVADLQCDDTVAVLASYVSSRFFEFEIDIDTLTARYFSDQRSNAREGRLLLNLLLLEYRLLPCAARLQGIDDLGKRCSSPEEMSDVMAWLSSR